MRSWMLAGVAAPRSSLLDRRAESFGWVEVRDLNPWLPPCE
jgi:hypothetical protein